MHCCCISVKLPEWNEYLALFLIWILYRVQHRTLIFTDKTAITEVLSGSKEGRKYCKKKKESLFQTEITGSFAAVFEDYFFWGMVFKTLKHHKSDSDFLQLWLVYTDAWNTLFSIHGSVWFNCWQIREKEACSRGDNKYKSSWKIT